MLGYVLPVVRLCKTNPRIHLEGIIGWQLHRNIKVYHLRVTVPGKRSFVFNKIRTNKTNP